MGDEKSAAGDVVEDEVEPSSPEIVFAPVVELPDLVPVTTMEEDEDELFKMRSKLYRMDNEAQPPEWKERGLGNLKILHHPKRFAYRIVMRREQTYKICANHAITPEMNLLPMAGSEKAFVWFTAADFADEEPKHETLAARFGSKEGADAFKAAFEETVKKSVAGAREEEKENVKEKKGEESKEEEKTPSKEEKVIEKVSSEMDKLSVKTE